MVNFIGNFLASSTIYIYESFTNRSLNIIGQLIKWLIDSIGNVGIGIIVFTLCLKLITLPLDIYSKASMRKNSLKMEKMRPQLEKLKKQYANDKVIYNQKMMALYKQEGYSMFGACLPTIVTLVFFIVVLTAFQNFSKYETLKTFNNMMDSYTSTVIDYAEDESGNKSEIVITQEKCKSLILKYNLQVEASATIEEKGVILTNYIKDRAREASANAFKEAKLGFLWVKNIWIPDNATAHPVQTLSKFQAAVNLKDLTFQQDRYDELTYNLAAEKKQPNGYFILIVISVLVTMLSQLVLGKSQKAQLELQSVDGQGAQTQKMMMYMMPIMIGIFAFMYTSAFCIYMISNSFFTIVTTILINYIVDIRFKKANEQEELNRINGRYNKSSKAKTNRK